MLDHFILIMVMFQELTDHDKADTLGLNIAICIFLNKRSCFVINDTYFSFLLLVSQYMVKLIFIATVHVMICTN